MQYLAAEHVSSGCFNGLCDFFFYRLVSTMISCLVSIIFPYRIYILTPKLLQEYPSLTREAFTVFIRAILS